MQFAEEATHFLGREQSGIPAGKKRLPTFEMGQCDRKCCGGIGDRPQAFDQRLAEFEEQIAVDVTGQCENEPLLPGRIAVAEIDSDAVEALPCHGGTAL